LTKFTGPHTMIPHTEHSIVTAELKSVIPSHAYS